MGTSQSIPNQGTKPVLDAIFNYMMNDLSIRDFIELSKEDSCKKYILFMANNMNTQFYEMKLFPYVNPQGVLMFRKSEDIINPSTEKERNERKSLCLVLAYFYTRIFQIYGAMALTLIDDAKFMEKSGILGSKLETPQYTPVYMGKFAPGHPGFVPPKMKGGGDCGYFEILGSYVDSSSGLFTNGYNIRYGGTDASIVLYIKNKSSTYQKGEFTIKYKGNNRSYNLITVIEKTADDTKCVMHYDKQLNYTDNGKLKVIPLNSESYTIIFDKKILKPFEEEYTIENQPIKVYFDKLFKKIIDAIRQYDPTTTGTGTGTGTIPTSNILGMDINAIYSNLTRHRPQGHCIARAMQLLDTQVQDKKSISHICKIKFMDGSRSGLPEKGERLSTSPGLSALSLLFYDVITIGTPQLNIGATDSPLKGKLTSLEQYINFMKLMIKRFMKDSDDSKTDMATMTLDKILNQRDKYVCDTSKINDNDIIVSDTMRGIVEKTVAALITQQIKHAGKCMEILEKLFQITKNQAGAVINISLHPNLINDGFSYLNLINYQVRQLLIDYYSNCEKTYIDGMEKIVTDKMTSDTSTGATTGATGATTGTTTGATTTIAPSQQINIIKQLQKNAVQNKLRRNKTVRGGSKRK